jgi:hypothetical protein
MAQRHCHAPRALGPPLRPAAVRLPSQPARGNGGNVPVRAAHGWQGAQQAAAVHWVLCSWRHAVCICAHPNRTPNRCCMRLQVFGFVLGRGALTLDLTPLQFVVVMLAPFMPAELDTLSTPHAEQQQKLVPGDALGGRGGLAEGGWRCAQSAACMRTRQPPPLHERITACCSPTPAHTQASAAAGGVPRQPSASASTATAERLHPAAPRAAQQQQQQQQRQQSPRPHSTRALSSATNRAGCSAPPTWRSMRACAPRLSATAAAAGPRCVTWPCTWVLLASCGGPWKASWLCHHCRRVTGWA